MCKRIVKLIGKHVINRGTLSENVSKLAFSWMWSLLIEILCRNGRPWLLGRIDLLYGTKMSAV